MERRLQTVQWLPEYLTCSTQELAALALHRVSLYHPRFAQGANAVVHLVETEPAGTLLVVKAYTGEPAAVFEEATYARGVADGSSPYICRMFGLASMSLPDAAGRPSPKTVSVMDYIRGRCGADLRNHFHQLEGDGRIANRDIWQFPMQYARDLPFRRMSARRRTDTCRSPSTVAATCTPSAECCWC